LRESNTRAVSGAYRVSRRSCSLADAVPSDMMNHPECCAGSPWPTQQCDNWWSSEMFPFMTEGSLRSIRGIVLCIVLCITLLSIPTDASANVDFIKYQGRWSGVGWFTRVSGDREKAKCRAKVLSLGGPQYGSIEVRCISKTYDIDLHTTARVRGRYIVGSWVLRTYSVTGSVSGHLTENGFTAFFRVGELNYGAWMSATLQECTALIAISTEQIEVKSVNIELRRC